MECLLSFFLSFSWRLENYESKEAIRKLLNVDKNTPDLLSNGNVDNWSSTCKFSVVFLSNVNFATVFYIIFNSLFGSIDVL